MIQVHLDGFFDFSDWVPDAFVFLEDADFFLAFDDVVEFLWENAVHDLVVFVIVFAVKLGLHVPVS